MIKRRSRLYCRTKICDHTCSPEHSTASAMPNHHYTAPGVKLTEPLKTPRLLSEPSAPTSQSSKPLNQSSEPPKQSIESLKQSAEPPIVSTIYSTAQSTTTKSTVHGSENPTTVNTIDSALSPCIKYKFTTAVKSKLHTMNYVITAKTTNSEGSPIGLSHSDEWDDDDDRRKFLTRICVSYKNASDLSN